MSKVVVAGLLLLGAYALGSIPSGYVLARLIRGIDIREYGSGNIGATNVLRTLGRAPAAIALIADTAKGAVPVLVSRRAGFPLWFQFVAGLVAVAGHMWPATLGFRGGRGVATAFGALLATVPLPALLTGGVFACVLAISRYVSLSSILGCLMAPILLFLAGYPAPLSLLASVVAGLIVWRHRANIQRLLDGKESRIGQRITPENEPPKS